MRFVESVQRQDVGVNDFVAFGGFPGRPAPSRFVSRVELWELQQWSLPSDRQSLGLYNMQV